MYLLVLWMTIAAGTPQVAATDGDDTPPPPAARVAASAGAFLPLGMSARPDAQRASVMSFGGYDGARSTGVVQALASLRILGPIDGFAGGMYTQGPNTLRPTFGVRATVLSEARHGIGGAVLVQYRPEGLTEGEGEIEISLAAQKHFGRVGVFGNLTYGQDPEAAERDGEVRLAALVQVAESWHLGVDQRLRFDLGSQHGQRAAKLEAAYDLQALATASYTMDAVSFVASAGVSAIEVAGNTTVGAVTLAGMASAF